ncbi:Mis12-domain-containing protein [Punctularia strigosozonata HHB-11173 SS5]|uniref:Mis12-domain-containing protein n=1 Tax=Punctularia strigosozonata (strain HHB-11173) TaxID=741275 RepID=UPI0004418120|nr:Mis12-domain-containing protein [Punctularia strigosozonata HHB-11173 SS5]EIN10910.1 Mis12-domain-containing protein [Punctularia strigosozonata HHB-11173 SS5]
MSASTTIAPASGAEALLLVELLGFVPQFFLDDLFGVAQEAANHTVEAMESYLARWAQSRSKTDKDDDKDADEDIEQGLVSFQTLLESHVDQAFDFLEAWSLRNILAVPSHLPVVVPHQRGLDLETPPERELELLAELEDLRRRMNNMRALRRLYVRAARKSRLQLRRAQAQRQTLSFLRTPEALSNLSMLPELVMQLRSSVSELPPVEELPSTSPSLPQGAGKRQWEVGKPGYEQWAVSQLLAKSRTRVGDKSGVIGMVERSKGVGSTEHLRAAVSGPGGTGSVDDESMEMDAEAQ